MVHFFNQKKKGKLGPKPFFTAIPGSKKKKKKEKGKRHLEKGGTGVVNPQGMPGNVKGEGGGGELAITLT